MGTFRWLHLSDFHFDDANNYEAYWDKLCSFIERNPKFQGCDYVFITGDIAKKGNYAYAVKYMETLISILKKINSNIKIFWVPGNHDAVLEGNKVREYSIKYMRTQGKDGYSTFLEIVNDKGRPLLTAFNEYESQRKQWLNDGYLEVSKDGCHYFYCDDNINILIFNTALTSLADLHEFDNLFVPLQELRTIIKSFKQPLNPTFLLAHHPFIYLNRDNQMDINEAIDDCADIYLCGHSHESHFNILPSKDHKRSTIFQITAGTCIGDWLQLEDKRFNFLCGEYCGDGEINVDIYHYSKGKWDIDNEHKDNLMFNFYPDKNSEKIVLPRLKKKPANDVILGGIDCRNDVESYFKLSAEQNSILRNVISQTNNDGSVDVSIILHINTDNEKKIIQ